MTCAIGHTQNSAGWAAPVFVAASSARKIQADACCSNFRAASPNINREMPVINKLMPTSVPMAQIELDGQ